ncbi:hypothetical protein D1AOALGA4SA_10740, partial [Olavius algarvensis Delta 1 endosymbiont]
VSVFNTLVAIQKEQSWPSIESFTMMAKSFALAIEPAHKLKIDQNKLQNCRSNILNLVNV